MAVLRQIETALKRAKPDVVLIAEPWSFRGHIAGALRDTGWASWNDGYRNFVRDYVRDGDTGIIVPAEDADAMRAGIERVLDDPREGVAMGRRGRQRVLEHHTMRDMAADLAPLLKAAAA